MTNILTLSFGLILLLGSIAGVLIGVSYAMYNKMQDARKTGLSYADIFRQQGIFLMVLFILWMSFFSYLRIQTAKPIGESSKSNSSVLNKIPETLAAYSRLKDDYQYPLDWINLTT